MIWKHNSIDYSNYQDKLDHHEAGLQSHLSQGCNRGKEPPVLLELF